MKYMKSIGAFLKQRDMYGYAINVHYRGSSTYQTWMGVFCTFLTYSVILYNVTIFTEAYLDHSKQEEKSDVQIVDRYFDDELYNLKENHFEIQLSSTIDVTEDIGRFVFHQVTPCDQEIEVCNYPKWSEDKVSKSVEIQSRPCTDDRYEKDFVPRRFDSF